ncbi:MAG: U32 family peptidase [Syntrophomonadaceae bacterium]|jgi:putative protease|nr:U32 family peptidase [Syntrophomonadaceae bacterium]
MNSPLPSLSTWQPNAVTPTESDAAVQLRPVVRPELLMPAGDLEKLHTALLFGGDAVYVGGQEYSLRAYARNFDLADLAQGVNFAHSMGKKVYVAVNILAHNRHLQELPPYLEKLGELDVDGLIVSDPGVIKLARQYVPHIPLTVSTQANVTNYASAEIFKEMGARRIVLARELALDEIADIKAQVGVEIEVFIHGAMCAAYSGRCLLSYYMTGRSANLGLCAHSCRYRYALQEEKRPGQYFPIEEDEHGTYILNSRDLCLLDYIPQLIEAGVDAFKVEGRMKSPLYTAVTARVYRQAIDKWLSERSAYSLEDLHAWHLELQGIATRPYTTGFIDGPADELQDTAKMPLKGPHFEFCGMVKGYDHQGSRIEVEQRANFGPGEDLEIMIPPGDIRKLALTRLYDHEGNPLDRARHARQRVWIPSAEPVIPNSILRRVVRSRGHAE